MIIILKRAFFQQALKRILFPLIIKAALQNTLLDAKNCSHTKIEPLGNSEFQPNLVLTKNTFITNEVYGHI